MVDVGTILAVVGGILLVAVVLLAVYYRQKQGPQPPAPPPAAGCWTPPDRAGDPLKGVYHPARLQIYSVCQTAEGTVRATHHESDGDVHIELVLDPAFAFLDKHNTGYLTCEIIPLDQPGGGGQDVAEPAVGQHIRCHGPWVFDTVHLWSEIHPVWKIVVLE